MQDISIKQHFIGCDVSKATLDFAIYERNKDYRTFEHLQVPNNREGYEAMRKWLKTFKIALKDAVIGMEHTGAYCVAFSEWCFNKGYMFVLLHPLDVKNAGARGRNKNDKVDAQFIADYVYTMREKLTPSQPESPIIKKLRQLLNERQLVVRSRTSFLNQAKLMGKTGRDTRQKKVILYQ